MALTQEEITKLNTAVEKCTRAARVTEEILDEIQNNSGRSEDIATAVTRLKNDYIATEESRGFVKPDGDTISVNAEGAISANTATTSTLGIVKPDDSSLQIDSNGILSIKTTTATTENSGFMSSEDKTKLDGIEAGAQVNTVTGIKGNSEANFRTGNVNITKAHIGLSNVENTADANKNVATAQTLAIARTISLSEGATGSASFDGSQDLEIKITGLDVSKASAGVLTVDRGGTGQSQTAEIRAGKDSVGNVIVDTYATKTELQNLRSGLYEVVNELPAVGEAGKMYLVAAANGSGTNVYKEYIFINNSWEETGAPELDLSSYSKKSETIRSLTVETISGGTRLTFTYANNLSDFVDIANTIIEPATQLPQPMGTASAGSSTKYAREDHVHPAQTIDLTNYSIKANTVKDIDYSNDVLTVTKGDDSTETFTIKSSSGGNSKVVSATTITGDNNCIANRSITFTLSAKSALVNTAITSFTVDGGVLGKQTVNASNDSATVTFDIPSNATAGTTYNINAYATDELGNTGAETVKIITVIAVSVATPTVTLSANSAYLGQSITVSTSEFSMVGTTDSHASTDYKVCSDSAGTTVVFQALASTDKTSHTISANDIGEGTRYIFVRHNSTNFGSSDWSTGSVVTISKPVVNTPSITLSKNSMYIGETITFTGSTFGLNVGTGSHAKTDWKVCSSNDVSSNAVWSSLNNTTNKTEITIQADTLSAGTKYAFVRYYDSMYDSWSGWSAVASFTVNQPVVNTPTVTVQSGTLYTTSSVALTGSSFGVTGGSGSHNKTDWKICASNDSSTTGVWSSLNDTSNKTSITVPANTLTAGTKYVFVRYFDSKYNVWSSWSTAASLTINAPYINTPTLSANPVTFYPNAATTLTASELSVTGSTASLNSAEFKVCATNSSSATAIWSGTANGNSITVPANSLTAGTRYAFVRYKDNNLGYSAWSSACTLNVSTPFVNKPSILVPVEGAEIDKSQGLAITLSNFAVTGGTDTLKESKALLYAADGTTLITSKTSSSTSISFSESELSGTSNGNYKIAATEEGNTLGISQISEFRNISVVSNTTPSGRIIYRHSSNKGSVIEFDRFGTAMKLFVADAVYRFKEQWITPSFTYQLMDSPFLSTWSDQGVQFIGDINTTGTAEELPSLTDSDIQNRFSLSNEKTAKYYCDMWKRYDYINNTDDDDEEYETKALNRCRNTLTGDITGGCDIPNIFEGIVIYTESNTLDSLDPTIDSNKDKRLSLALPKTTGVYVDPNRWFDGGEAWISTTNKYGSLFIAHYGRYYFTGSSTDTRWVIPIKEL